MSWVWFQDALGAGTTQFSMPAASGAYALTGYSTGLELIAAPGAFVLSGNDAALRAGREAPAAVTPYALSGGDIGPFIREHLMIALRGEYKIAAPHVLMHRTRVPILDPVPFVEEAWEQPENESNLDAQVEWEAG